MSENEMNNIKIKAKPSARTLKFLNTRIDMNPFETDAEVYDEWFDRHEAAYASELSAVRAALDAFAPCGRGVEIGAGTGRFAAPLGIADGIEPAASMRKLAEGRGLHLKDGTAEELPYENESFDFALLITTICFVDDPQQTCREAARVLRDGGRLLIGLVPRDSFLGRHYEVRRQTSRFYRSARFFTVEETKHLMKTAGFGEFACLQTLFNQPEKMTTPDPVLEGYNCGGFVVLTGINRSGGIS
jgi:SAM-dependent methyltransferase